MVKLNNMEARNKKEFLNTREIEPDVRTLPRLLREWAKKNPEGIAMRQKRYGLWKELTWSQYEVMVSGFAHGLIDLGYKRGAHIGILSENRQEWLIAEIGMHLIGIIPAGVYPTSPPNEILHILASTDSNAVICEDQEQVDKILEIIDELPYLKQVIVIDDKGLSSYKDSRLISWENLLSKGMISLHNNPEIISFAMQEHSPDDVAIIVPTSGSTGMPKPAMITFRNIHFLGKATGDVVGGVPSDSVVSYLPLCHVAEQLFSVFFAMYGGYTANFGESVRTVQQDLRDIAPTVFLGVPRIWERMLAEIIIRMNNASFFQKLLIKMAIRESKNFSDPWAELSLFHKLRKFFWEFIVYRHIRNAIGLTRCRFAISGAAPISLDTLKFFRGLGVPLMEGFGMTETGGACAIQLLDKKSEGNIGFPIPGVEMKTSDENELLIKGQCVFAGYYNNIQATEETIKDGWLYTGDIAEVFSDGSVSILDRKKDIMITSGGKNLTPSLIENMMKSSPYIKECILVAEGRKFPSALVQIDYEVVGDWAEKKDLVYTTFRSLSEMPEVFALIDNEINSKNEKLARVEQIKKFHLLTKELDHDDGEVTATMKVRRSKIAKFYSKEIESMYE